METRGRVPDPVPCRAPCVEPASPSNCVSATLSLSLSLSLINKILNKQTKKDLIYLFMRDTQRESQKHRQREKQAPCGEPHVGLHPGSRITPGAKGRHLTLGHPGFFIGLCLGLLEDTGLSPPGPGGSSRKRIPGPQPLLLRQHYSGIFSQDRHRACGPVAPKRSRGLVCALNWTFPINFWTLISGMDFFFW